MKTKLLLKTLFITLSLALSTKVQAQIVTEELTYEQLLQRVSAQKKAAGSNRTSLISESNSNNKASMAFFTGWLNLSPGGNKENITATTQGLELGWARQFVNSNVYEAYFAYRNYGFSRTSELSAHEGLAQVQRPFEISATLKALVGGGASLRLTNYSNRNEGISAITPLLALQSGIDYKANSNWTLSALVSARSLFITESADKNSLDIGFKAATQF